MSDATLQGTWPLYADDEIEAAVNVLRSGKANQWTGEQCRRFGQEYADHCGTRHGIALANGSVALELALEAAGVGKDDDVIVTPRSFIASASCAIRVGARPVFADVDRDSQNLTAETIAAALTPATRAVVVVHHAGWPCEMDDIMSLAEDKGLVVIEDCAQAHGATCNGRPVGSLGHVGAFSFCQDKIISTGGEGGMLVTDDKAIWERAWSIKDHGKDHDAAFSGDHPPGFAWLHESIGTNWRMTEAQAAIGRMQLQKLPEWRAKRAENARRISAALSQYPSLRVPDVPEHIEHAWYRLYAFVRNDRLADGWTRDGILAALSQHGIPGLSGTCPAIYREKAFQDRGLAPGKPLPIVEELGATSLAFLVHPTLTEDDIERTCNAVNAVFETVSR